MSISRQEINKAQSTPLQPEIQHASTKAQTKEFSKDDELINKTIKMVNKIRGIKFPGMDEIIKYSEGIYKEKTSGETLIDTALQYNPITKAINILAWLGNHSSDNNISNQLIEQSTQLLKSRNKIESDEAWQAAVCLKIFEGIAESIGKIKQLLTNRINQLGPLVKLMNPLELSNKLLNSVYLEKVESHYQKGRDLCNKEGKYLAALDEFNAALALKKDHWGSLYYRGRCFQAQYGDYQKAISDYEQALKINPSFVEAHYQQGMCHLFLKEHAKALVCLDK
jgi:tetratricopeptide (TPR) repeat protein